MDIDEKLPEVAEGHLHLYRKRLPLCLALQEIVRSVGDVDDEHVCLDVGIDNGAMSYQLHRAGGTWHSVVFSPDLVEPVRAVVGDRVHALKGVRLPFKKKVFDVVVLVDMLERIELDDEFISECHRVIKHDGRIVIATARLKSWSLVNVFKKLLGSTRERSGHVRAGYSESQLFSILKHGFDVESVRTYSRFFVELVDTVVCFLDRGYQKDIAAEREKWWRLYSVAGFFYRLADQLDMILFFTRGYYMIAAAKRRAWRPRNAPILVDGRSISEAVLSKSS